MKIIESSTREINKFKVAPVSDAWLRDYHGEIGITIGDMSIYLGADEARDFANELQAAYWQNMGRIAAEQDAGRLALRAQKEAEAAALKAQKEAVTE